VQPRAVGDGKPSAAATLFERAFTSQGDVETRLGYHVGRSELDDEIQAASGSRYALSCFVTACGSVWPIIGRRPSAAVDVRRTESLTIVHRSGIEGSRGHPGVSATATEILVRRRRPATPVANVDVPPWHLTRSVFPFREWAYDRDAPLSTPDFCGRGGDGLPNLTGATLAGKVLIGRGVAPTSPRSHRMASSKH